MRWNGSLALFTYYLEGEFSAYLFNQAKYQQFRRSTIQRPLFLATILSALSDGRMGRRPIT